MAATTPIIPNVIRTSGRVKPLPTVSFQTGGGQF